MARGTHGLIAISSLLPATTPPIFPRHGAGIHMRSFLRGSRRRSPGHDPDAPGRPPSVALAAFRNPRPPADRRPSAPGRTAPRGTNRIARAPRVARRRMAPHSLPGGPPRRAGAAGARHAPRPPAPRAGGARSGPLPSARPGRRDRVHARGRGHGARPQVPRKTGGGESSLADGPSRRPRGRPPARRGGRRRRAVRLRGSPAPLADPVRPLR
jgi:hypothetical protein